MPASIDDLAGLELDLRMKRARTVNEQASVRQDILRARRDPAFRARLAEIVSQGQYQSGPWGKAQLGLAAASAAPLAGLLPVVGSAIGPVGTVLGGLGAAGLMGLGGANIREGMQRRREGLPGGGLQMGLGAADILLSPLGTGVGGLLKRGLRRGATRALPAHDYSVEVLPQRLLPKFAESLQGERAVPPAGGVSGAGPFGYSATGGNAAATPQASILRGWDDFKVPGGDVPHPSTRTTSTAWRTEDPLRTGGYPPVDVPPRDPRTRTTGTAWTAPTGTPPPAPWGVPTGAGARVSPDFGAQAPRPKPPPKTPTGTPEPTATPQRPTPTQAEAAQTAATSTKPTPAPVALAQIREELQGAGLGTAQLGFLESFLGQVDDVGEPVLQALREAALDTPESRRLQTVLMDRLIRHIPAQGGVGVATPKLRASMAHLFAGGGGGGQAKVPGGLLSPSAGRTVIPAGAINPATGEVTEQALLRGQMPGTERSFGLGHKGVTAPTETMEAFSSTVGGTSPEWTEAAKQVEGLITEGMTPAQIKAVTGYQVAFNRLDGLKRYIQRVLQFDPHRQRGAGGQFRQVGDKELIGDLVKTQGTRPRTIYRDLRGLARKVAKGEVTTEHMQKTIDQINKTALQLLGVIGSIEMARRVLAPGQTPNATLT